MGLSIALYTNVQVIRDNRREPGIPSAMEGKPKLSMVLGFGNLCRNNAF